jgi:hypothetical protein
MHVLNSMGTDDPPIRELTYQERFKKMWVEPNCLRENIIKVLDKIETPCAQVDSAKGKL